MSDTVFLVQVLPYLRFLYDSGEGVRRGPGISGSFTSYEQAQAWSERNFPIEQNPFADILNYDEDDGSEILYFVDDTYITGDDLRLFLTEAGLIPPEKRKPEDIPLRYDDLRRTPDGAPNWDFWFRWWEAKAPEMTEAQKTAIWKFLAPKPYRIVEVEME